MKPSARQVSGGTMREIVSMFILVCSFLGSHEALAQQDEIDTCINYERRLTFKSPSAPGARSWIIGENMPLSAVIVGDTSTLSFADIIVEVEARNRFNSSDPWTRDLGLDGTNISIRVSTYPQVLTLRSNAQSVSKGTAYFSGLGIVDDIPLNNSLPVYLNFSVAGFQNETAQIDYYQPMKLLTGQLNFQTTGTAENRIGAFQFSPAGFFSFDNQERVIPVSPTPIPTFSLVAMNLLGARFTTFSWTVQLFVERGTLSSNRETIHNGFVALNNLRYTPPAGDTSSVIRDRLNITLTRAWNSFEIQSFSLSVRLVVEKEPRLGRHIRFAAGSFLTVDNEAQPATSSSLSPTGFGGGKIKSVVIGLSMPRISIEVLTSWFAVDTSVSDLLITATSDQAVLEGSTVKVTNGVAHFDDLAFTSQQRSAVITFTAGYEGNYPVAGEVLYSGQMTIDREAQRGAQLSYAASSFVRPEGGKIKYLRKADDGTIVLKNIAVQMRDSAQRLDLFWNIPRVEVLIQEGSSFNVRNVGNFPLTSGIGVLPQATAQVSAALTETVVSVADTGSNLGVSSQKILLRRDELTTSAKIAEAYTACIPSSAARDLNGDCQFTLAFGPSSRSFVYEENQDLFSALDEPLPEIRVRVIDIFDETRTQRPSDVPDIYAYTGNDPATETLLVTDNSANKGQWQGTEYVFSCLRFRELPSELVKITFRLYQQNSLAGGESIPLAGIPTLSTGFVTVTTLITPGYGLRFGKDGSLFTYSNQPSSAVLGQVLSSDVDYVVIEVEDSAHNFDPTANNVLIVAETSSGKLAPEGAQAIVQNGRALFDNLRFTEIADEAFITFTARQTTPLLTGKSVRTGFLTLSALPLPLFEIAFSPELSTDNDVTREFQTFTYRTLAASDQKPIKASIIVRNSAHKKEPLVQRVRIEVASVEGVELGASQKIIGNTEEEGADASANFSTSFLGFHTGFSGANIYLTYTAISEDDSTEEADVTAGETNLLIGKQLVVGPIRTVLLEGEEGSSTQTCSRALQSPIVVVEFQLTEDEFDESVDAIITELALRMGVANDRVTWANLRQAEGTDPLTVARWIGIKVDITFTDPSADSVNKKSSAVLAAEFVALRSPCVSEKFGLQNVYYKSRELQCDVERFNRVTGDEVTDCIERAYVPRCHCYNRHVFQPLGANCLDEPTLNAQLNALCTELILCQDAYIMDVCTVVLQRNKESLIPLYAAAALVGSVLIGVFVAWRKQLWCFKPKMRWSDATTRRAPNRDVKMEVVK